MIVLQRLLRQVSVLISWPVLSDIALSSQSRLLTAASCQCWELAMQLAVTMVISCLLFVPRGGHFVHVAPFTFHPKTAASVICPQFDCDNI